jgi:hypothetical protein
MKSSDGLAEGTGEFSASSFSVFEAAAKKSGSGPEILK